MRVRYSKVVHSVQRYSEELSMRISHVNSLHRKELKEEVGTCLDTKLTQWSL